MYCVYKEMVSGNPGYKRCVIQADTTPTTFPVTGDNVENLEFETHIATGSILYCVDTGKSYFMNESGTAWNPYGGE